MIFERKENLSLHRAPSSMLDLHLLRFPHIVIHELIFQRADRPSLGRNCSLNISHSALCVRRCGMIEIDERVFSLYSLLSRNAQAPNHSPTPTSFFSNQKPPSTTPSSSEPNVGASIPYQAEVS